MTRFEFIDAGGYMRAVQASWGSGWGHIEVGEAARVDQSDYSCAFWTPCTEVTGADGSMTYVAGPIVGPEPSESPSAGGSNLPPAGQPRQVITAELDFVFSYHPDGSWVWITLDPKHAPANLTIPQLVAVGLAFSAVS